MRYRMRVTLLALGTVFGFASGFASLACHHHRHDRRAAFEQHVSRLCADAAIEAHHRGYR